MKIAILNFSGNVGKTTIARDLFKLNLGEDYSIISIESANADGKEEIILKAENGDEIYAEALVQDNLILDIGSSNLEQFLEYAKKRTDLFEGIDKFVIPSSSSYKALKDTANTVAYLDLELEVPIKKILIIGNLLEEGKKEETSFADLAKDYQVCKNYIYKHNLYTQKPTIAELLSDRDFRAEMEEAKRKGDIDTAREFAFAYIEQEKVRDLLSCYQKILAEIIGDNNE